MILISPRHVSLSVPGTGLSMQLLEVLQIKINMLLGVNVNVIFLQKS
jgi:hypothetical protein